MFLAETLTSIRSALTSMFDGDYPVESLRNVNVSVEYPSDLQEIPSLWIDVSLDGSLSRSGIGHTEYVYRDDNTYSEVVRWGFQAEASITIITLSSLSRAQLLDEVIRVVGMQVRSEKEGFTKRLIGNKMINLTPSTDELSVSGMAITPGTPWGTEDLMYEVTVGFDIIGDFASTHEGVLVPLSAIHIIANET